MAAGSPSPRDLIHRKSGDPARQQHLGPYVIEDLLTEAEEGAGTVYRVRIEPGCRTSVSYHRRAEEYYYVLSGSGKAFLGGREYELAAGDFLRLPPGTTHAFLTADEPLEMLNVHTPGCRPDRDVYFVDEVPRGFTAPPPGQPSSGPNRTGSGAVPGPPTPPPGRDPADG